MVFSAIISWILEGNILENIPVRESGKINVTYIISYIEADHNILNCSALAWAAQPLANIKPKIGLRLLIITSEVSCMAWMVKGCVLSQGYYFI